MATRVPGRTGGPGAILAAMLFVALAAGCGANGSAGVDAIDVPGTDVPMDAGRDVPIPDVPTEDLATPDLTPGDAPPADLPPGDAPHPDASSDLPDVAPGTPILDRPPDLRFDCRVARGLTNHAPRSWANASHAPVATTGGTIFLARAESAPAEPFDPAARKLLVSPFGLDGTFGNAAEIPAAADAITGIDAAPRGDGFLVAWSDGTLHTAARGSDGGPAAAITTLAGRVGDTGTRPVLAPLAPGFGMAWSAPGPGARRTTHFARLDADGALAGKVLDLAVTSEDGYDDPAPAIAAGTGRWGIAWQETAAGRGQVYFAAVESDGTLGVPAKRISSTDEDGVTTGSAAFSRPRVSLVATSSGWLAAWSEVRTGADFMSGASAIIRVARLDRDGTPLDEAPVREVVVDRDEVEPVLVPFQGVVALLWSSGTHIYICGGCMPDDRVDLVLLDPATLRPVSGVTPLPPPTRGGLLDVAVAGAGSDLLATLGIRYHVSGDSASALWTCEAR